MTEPRRSLRADHVDATVRALLAAARKLFGTAGFAATSVDGIAAEARVTKGAVYHHFASKEDLFRAVHDEVEGEVQLRCAAAGASARAKGPIAQLLKGVDAYLDAALEPDVQRITLVDGPAILGLEAAAAPPGEEAARAGMRAMIQAAIDAGAIRRVDPDSLTHLVRGACMQAGMLIARSDTPAQTRKRIGTTIHALLEGLATT